MLKKLLFVLVLLPSIAFGQSNIPQGGTGLSTSTPGDLLVGTSSIRYSRLPVGSSGSVLQASSTSPFRMEWVATSSLFSSLLSSNNTWTGTNNFTASTTLTKIIAGTSAGIQFFSNGLTQIADFGAGGGSNASFYGGVNVTGNLAVDTDTLYVDTTNNRVGIGTTTPGYNAVISGSDAALSIDNNSGSASFIRMNNHGTQRFVLDARSAATSFNSLTAPFAFITSSIERVRIDNSGFVGIGTTTPNSLLTLASASSPSISIRESTNNLYTLVASTNLVTRINGADRLTLSSGGAFTVNAGNFLVPSGNVGIGTSSPQFDLTLEGSTNVDFMMRDNAQGLNLKSYLFRNTGGNLAIGRVSDNAGSLTTYMTFLNGGNIGIGTTTPTSLVSVASSTATGASRLLSVGTSSDIFTVLANGETFVSTRLGVGTAPNASWAIRSGGSISMPAGGLLDWGFGNARIIESSYNLLFSTWNGSNLTEKMRITGGGNIGIGTTTPESQLTIASSTLTGTSKLMSVGTTSGVFTVQANGRVGIGSNVGTPTAPLHVFTPVANSTTVTGQYIINAGSGAGAGTELLLGYAATTAGTGGIASFYDTSHFGGTVGVKTRLSAGGTTFLTGSVTGDVGIGTSTPYARLAVQGQSGSSTPVFIVASSTGSTPYFTVTAAGNIGVSSAAPPARIYLNQLSGGATGGFLIGQGDSATNYAAALYRESSVNYGVLGLFDGNTTARVSLRGGVGIDSYFNSGGDLGVGTTTPTSLLTVASSTTSTSYSIFGVFNALANPIMNILGSGAVLFGTITTANCGNAPCGLTVATTTQFTAGTVARVVGYASAASTTINLNTTDIATTTIDRATTFVNPTGTAYDGSMFEIRAKATTTQTVYWDTVFASSTDLTNVSSVASGTTRFLFEYRQDVGKWELVGKLGQYIN